MISTFMNLRQQQEKAKTQLPPYAQPSSAAQIVKSFYKQVTFHCEVRFGISRKRKRCKVEMKRHPFRA